jgi:bifunctional DNA-binding transcriptional regulator/antitoxin component of YhaV-PrlF toxin-antitoxin module
MRVITKITKGDPEGRQKRTTIPSTITERFNLEIGDILIWEYNHKQPNNPEHIKVTPKRKTDI